MLWILSWINMLCFKKLKKVSNLKFKTESWITSGLQVSTFIIKQLKNGKKWWKMMTFGKTMTSAKKWWPLEIQSMRHNLRTALIHWKIMFRSWDIQLSLFYSLSWTSKSSDVTMSINISRLIYLLNLHHLEMNVGELINVARTNTFRKNVIWCTHDRD